MKRKYEKSCFLLTALFILTVSNISAQYPGTNLRGQIQYLNPKSNKYYPLSKASVKLFYNSSPGHFMYMGETITDSQGFYYFYSIKPGNGRFYILVNDEQTYKIAVQKITYINSRYNYNQFQDLPIQYY